MPRFNETILINTVFGNVSISYVESIETENVFTGKVETFPSGYRAVMNDGDFNGWNNFSEGSHSSAIAGLMEKIAERYGREIMRGK